MADKIKIAVKRAFSEPYQAEVEGKVFGAWAAHLSTTGLHYAVTFVRFGLAIPYEFWTERGARKAAKTIDALRANWDDATAADIKAMAADIFAICDRESGERTCGTKVTNPVPVTELPTTAAAE